MKNESEQLQKCKEKMNLVNISPFDPICNKWAVKCDEAIISNDREIIKELADELKAFLSMHDEPGYSPLFYAMGNLLSELCVKYISERKHDNPYTDCEFIQSHSNAIWYFRHAEDLLDKIEKDENNLPCLADVYSSSYMSIMLMHLNNAAENVLPLLTMEKHYP